MNCLLCNSEQVTLVGTSPAKKLIAEWRVRYNIDIAPELGKHERIDMYQCQTCYLQFFPPELAGSNQLYTQLQRFDWYYMPRKWEHDAAVRDMRRGDRVLEVGCGVGDFVERMHVEEQLDASGIELNPTAVDDARKLGRSVSLKNVKDMAREQRGRFDVVCSFQVLEHIPDPARFINACINLLNPAGRLLISLPDSSGFIRLEDNDLLNQPPHHVSRWSKRVLECLPQYFPLRLCKILYEPLASYHLDWYAKLQLNRLPYVRFLTRNVHGFVHKLLLPMVQQTGWYRFLRGHTIYGHFQNL